MSDKPNSPREEGPTPETAPCLREHHDGCPALGTQERRHCDCGRYEDYEHKLELYGESLARRLQEAQRERRQYALDAGDAYTKLSAERDASLREVEWAHQITIKKDSDIYALTAERDAALREAEGYRKELTEAREQAKCASEMRDMALAVAEKVKKLAEAEHERAEAEYERAEANEVMLEACQKDEAISEEMLDAARRGIMWCEGMSERDIRNHCTDIYKSMRSAAIAEKGKP